MSNTIEKQLLRIYTDPHDPGSYGGIERFYRSAKQSIPKLTRNQVLSFLKKHRPYTLHRPYRKNFSRNPTIVSGIDKQWQADLVDMQSVSKENKGNKYLLTVIDCFSKYAWAIPIRNKSGIEIRDAFSKLFTSSKRIPLKIQTDKGKEFLNKEVQEFFEEKGVSHFVTQNETKAAMVERFNRTLKARMWNFFTTSGSSFYLDALDQLVDSYNHSFHRSIGMRPVDVNKEMEEKVFHKLYGKHFAISPDRKSLKNSKKLRKTKDGYVRISKSKTVFEKGYRPNWTEEIFKIVKKQKKPSKSVYKIQDQTGDEIAGTFYPEELQEVYYDPNEPQPIEKIIRTRVNKAAGGIKEHLVKWLNCSDKFNSWVPDSELTKI